MNARHHQHNPADPTYSPAGAAFWPMLRRDLLLSYRRRSEVLQPLIFLLVVVSLFPLGVGPSPEKLAGMSQGVIWIAALLATVLSLDSLFRPDFEDGSLEQWVLAGHSLAWVALAKVLAHWLVAGLPIVLLAPLLAIWMNLPEPGLPVLVISLIIGTPVLSLIGAIGGALTVSTKRGGQMLSLLVFPLYVPLLIMATSAVISAIDGLSYAGQLGMMAAGLVAALTLAPFAIAAALKLSLE